MNDYEPFGPICSIVFTGLPARGKTHISRRLARYLEFFHAIPVELFDVATYRRKICGAINDAAWFDNTNEEGVGMRDMCNKQVLEDVFEFLEKHHNGVGNEMTSNNCCDTIFMYQLMHSHLLSLSLSLLTMCV